MTTAATSRTFAYSAQTFAGKAMTGTIDAADLEDASTRLSGLGLRVTNLQAAQRLPRAKPLGGEDFAAFNQQLAHLSAAQLPIEQGLRLIAEDLDHGGLSQSIREVSAELDRGVELGEAFKRHEKLFPPLYGTLIEAGVRSGNLPAVLLNLGRHLELVSRLRAAIWRAISYPLVVVGGLLIIMIFLGHFVLPEFSILYNRWYVPLPASTKILLVATSWTPVLIGIAITLFVGVPLIFILLRAMRLDRSAADLLLVLPLIGPVLRRNLIARWCDVMKIAVQGGIDLPGAVQLACDVVGSPVLQRDGRSIVKQLAAGNAIDQMPQRLRVLPPALLAVVQLATERNELPSSLETLATMYEQQAEMRVAAMQAILGPLLLVAVGAIIAFVVLALFAPLISLFRVWS